jgi:hypothetical protein
MHIRDSVGELALATTALRHEVEDVHMSWNHAPASCVHITHLPKLVRGGFPAARCAEMFFWRSGKMKPHNRIGAEAQ